MENEPAKNNLANSEKPPLLLEAEEILKQRGIDIDCLETIDILAEAFKDTSGIPSTGENLKLTPDEAESLVHHIFINPRYEKNFPRLFER